MSEAVVLELQKRWQRLPPTKQSPSHVEDDCFYRRLVPAPVTFPDSRQPDRHSIPIALGPAQFNEFYRQCPPQVFPTLRIFFGAGTADRMLFIIGNLHFTNVQPVPGGEPRLARVPTIAADPPPCDHAALRPNAGPNGRASPRTRCARELPAATRNLAPHAAKGVVISRPAEHGSGKLTSLYLGFLQAKHIRLVRRQPFDNQRQAPAD